MSNLTVLLAGCLDETQDGAGVCLMFKNPHPSSDQLGRTSAGCGGGVVGSAVELA